MVKQKAKVMVGDFETTVFEGQDHTEVWASACVELYTEDVHIFHSIEEQFAYFKSLNCSIICYYHNLKFDGSFWLSYLMIKEGYKHASEGEEGTENFHWKSKKEMSRKTLTYSISEMGQWYRIVIKTENHTIELRDSLKLLPFSLKRIGDSFQTKHKKLNIEYKGFRYAGCPISDEEKSYIANDVLVIKEALEILMEEGHNRLTIGSCCLGEYKKLIGRKKYEELFPNLYEIPLDEKIYGFPNAGKWVKQSYHGGWCYLAKGKENRIFHNGTTADVNSLYPSVMSSESLNFYPVGLPTFWSGNYIPDEALNPRNFYFVRFRTRFYLKKGMLPFIQVKNSLLYHMREMLETSDIRSHFDGKYYDHYKNLEGKIVPATVTLTMTNMDFELLKKHYDLVDFEILDGCYFKARMGIFDEYIEKYKKIKLESTGAKRELAKLFLNNLYGKMAASTNSNFKTAYVKEDGVLGYYIIRANDKVPGYIPVGSSITSYARNFTIKAAQKNYYGPDKPGFIYADTDSIHCDLQPDEIKGITEHSKNFCCWKLESCWDDAFFVRAKTYIEHITHENRELVDNPYYKVTCAGMPQKCKDLFIQSVMQKPEFDTTGLSEEELKFISERRSLDDFTIGLTIPGKLYPKTISGGVVLVDTTYQMR